MCKTCLVHRRLSFDENVRAKERGKETTGACCLYPSHGPLRFITSHSRFALASAMRKTKRLRRRLVQNSVRTCSFDVAVAVAVAVAVVVAETGSIVLTPPPPS